MAEGDTIFRAARQLQRALAGATVTAFTSPLPRLASLPVPGVVAGRTIDEVEARGKHLLMIFSGRLVLRTHMRMHGSWHLYRPGERWRARRADMRLLVETAEWHAVGFSVPVAEWLTLRAVARHPALIALGPDLLAPAFDATEAARRLVAQAGTPIADALLDQRALAGIGNVFKSEVLFACRVHPFADAVALDAVTIDALVRTAAEMLRRNVAGTLAAGGHGRRTTNRLAPGESLWVYRRAGRPCHRCGTAIEVRRSGRDARSTYWCPRCQAEPEKRRVNTGRATPIIA